MPIVCVLAFFLSSAARLRSLCKRRTLPEDGPSAFRLENDLLGGFQVLGG